MASPKRLDFCFLPSHRFEEVSDHMKLVVEDLGLGIVRQKAVFQW
jgi:hypothetical protein